MPSNLRRLAADHAALRHELPPYYMLPLDDGHSSDDLSQLTILLAGPAGTPYSQGLWRLHLKMPAEYPKSPPKATFRTKIWHPNVEENTGAVCVDTLKRDWQSKLTLRDVLVTISCLLIHPNPDSALNSSAGTLLREDFQNFAHQAKLMTSIHAPVPPNYTIAVREAQYRGEDPGTISEEKEETATMAAHTRPRKHPRLNTGTAIKSTRRTAALPPTIQQQPAQPTQPQDENMSDSENEDPASASKENNPSLSPTPIRQTQTPTSPRKGLGKRPLSVLSIQYPEDQDTEMMIIDTDDDQEQDTNNNNNNNNPYISPSEQNISANTRSRSRSRSPRKSPKRVFRKQPQTSAPQSIPPFRLREGLPIYEDVPDRTLSDFSPRFGGITAAGQAQYQNPSTTTAGPSSSFQSPQRGSKVPLSNVFAGIHADESKSSSRSVSGLVQSKVSKKIPSGRKNVSKAKPRIGVRRL